MQDERDFLMQEYIALRKEIEQIKARTYSIVAIGIVGIPGAQFLAKAYNIDPLTVVIPLLVIVLALSYLSDNHGLMRCGRYIREHIEPAFSTVVGWETWLEEPKHHDRRSVDRFASGAFFVLFLVYYILSTALACARLRTMYGIVAFSVGLGVYIALGLMFLGFLFMNIKNASSTKERD
jgi:hypothetical protein